jgi:hypothetical protein
VRVPWACEAAQPRQLRATEAGPVLPRAVLPPSLPLVLLPPEVADLSTMTMKTMDSHGERSLSGYLPVTARVLRQQQRTRALAEPGSTELSPYLLESDSCC